MDLLLYLPVVSKGIFKHSLPVSIVMILGGIDFRCTSLNGLLHHVIHVRNKQTDNSSYPICTFRLQRSKVAHGFMQMKNRSIDVQLCNMNAAVIISKTKVFRRTELCIE